MTDHDPLCQASLNGNDDIYFCICEFIAKVRADERERTVAREADKHIATVAWNKQAVLADLHAKVEALWLTQIIPAKRDTYGAAIKDVLVLIDGSNG